MGEPSPDDFGAFKGHEQMFFGLTDPFGMIRSETEATLRQQVADSELAAIQTYGEPRFLTLGRKIEDGSQIVVTHFGFCVRAKLAVRFDRGTKGEVLDAALTFVFGDVDKPGSERTRTYFDVHEEADRAYSDEVFKQRFLAFRAEKMPQA